MRRHILSAGAALALALANGLAITPAAAQDAGPVPFRKVVLNPQFYSEGINVGDLDKDGALDIIAGAYWYQGPGFTLKKAFRTPRATPFPISGDSDCYSIFVFDFNQDGWPDILSTRLPGGAEVVWYENPKGADRTWTERMAFTPAENESAALLDMDRDGKPELITNSKGYGGWALPDWANPERPWTFRAVTRKKSWGQFTHGIGAGDVNGDGRLDLIFGTGWWEQPADAADTPWVEHAGTFGGQSLPQEGFGGAQMFAYDVDGDLDNDIVTSHQAHGWGLAWHENLGGGTAFAARMIMGTAAERDRYGAAFAQLHAVALADLDGDGLKDIVTGKRKGAHGNGLGAELDSPAVLYWFRLEREAGKPVRYVPYRIDSEAGAGTQLTVVDVNGDRSPDILTARREGAFAFLNQKPFPASLGPVPPGRESHPGRRRPMGLGGAYWRFPIWDALGRPLR